MQLFCHLALKHKPQTGVVWLLVVIVPKEKCLTFLPLISSSCILLSSSFYFTISHADIQQLVNIFLLHWFISEFLFIFPSKIVCKRKTLTSSTVFRNMKRTVGMKTYNELSCFLFFLVGFFDHSWAHWLECSNFTTRQIQEKSECLLGWATALRKRTRERVRRNTKGIKCFWVQKKPLKI